MKNYRHVPDLFHLPLLGRAIAYDAESLLHRRGRSRLGLMIQ
jgi:hypothetical protein